MKKAIIIGHNAKNKGAFSEYFGLHEFDFYSQMELRLKEIGTVYYHNPLINSYSERMRQTAVRINQHDYDIVMALHFNGFNTQAQGCEALYFHTNDFGMQISDRFCNAIGDVMGIKKRGVKPLSRPNQRGYYELYYPKATTITLEPFFGDNISDCEKFNINDFLHILYHL